MKKLFIITALALGVSACGGKLRRSEQSLTIGQDNFANEYGTKVDWGSYQVVTIDSCEYIAIRSEWTLLHKGNCKNPIHKK